MSIDKTSISISEKYVCGFEQATFDDPNQDEKPTHYNQEYYEKLNKAWHEEYDKCYKFIKVFPSSSKDSEKTFNEAITGYYHFMFRSNVTIDKVRETSCFLSSYEKLKKDD